MEDGATRTVLLTVQYDGGAFSGWQHQPALRTVQGVLGDAVTQMVHHPVELHASSRTDAGVHARAMPVAFDTLRAIPASGFLRGLNAILPDDLSVTTAVEAPYGFRPREASVAKTYRYIYQLGPRRALTGRHAWWLKRDALDIGAMRDAALLYIGEHDYAAFRSVHCDAKSTMRHIHTATVSDADAEGRVCFEVTGNAFLRNMVRVMAGALAAVGLGRRPPAWVGELLATRIREDAAQTAPACGLTLAEVHFRGYPRIGKGEPSTPLPAPLDDAE
jgi:tRNA pseudouridine38-40 synthase